MGHWSDECLVSVGGAVRIRWHIGFRLDSERWFWTVYVHADDDGADRGSRILLHLKIEFKKRFDRASRREVHGVRRRPSGTGFLRGFVSCIARKKCSSDWFRATGKVT